MFRRAIHALASRPARPLPDLPPAATPSSLLALAKRGLEARHAKLFPTVQDLFSKTVADLRDAGVPVTDRRLIALLVEKLRSVSLVHLTRC